MKWINIFLKTLSILRRIIDVVTNYVFSVIYNGHSEPLPIITNLLLLETASSLALRIRSGKLKSRILLEAYIERIREVQPVINCIVDDRFEEALKEADEVDSLVQSGTKSLAQMASETPLLGLPFTTKDSISCIGMSHTAGMVSRRNVKGERDAEVVARFKKAGAIPVAVTNISELCMWWESSNNLYGRCNNPYNTSRIVGGSSGGEAAIQASAASIIGIGNDVGGSVRMPAFFCGIFGHKPSPGVIPNDGQIPQAEGEIRGYLGTGPMCRYASDLPLLVKVMAGTKISKFQLDDKIDISKLKVFYTTDECGNPFVSPLSKEMKYAQSKVLSHFQNAFKTKPTKLTLTTMKCAFEMWSSLMTCASAPSFCSELALRKGEINPFWELLKWFIWCSPHTLPAIALGISEKMSPKKDTERATRMVNLCSDFRREIEEALGDDGVLIFPSHPEPAPYHHQPLFKPLNFTYTAIFNVLGLPVTQCPLGLNSKGLPLGVQVVGASGRDCLTLAVAMELEKAFGGWVCPSAII